MPEGIEQAMQQVIMYHQKFLLCRVGGSHYMANTVLSDIPLMSDAQQGRKAAVQAANTLGNLGVSYQRICREVLKVLI